MTSDTSFNEYCRLLTRFNKLVPAAMDEKNIRSRQNMFAAIDEVLVDLRKYPRWNGRTPP